MLYLSSFVFDNVYMPIRNLNLNLNSYRASNQRSLKSHVNQDVILVIVVCCIFIISYVMYVDVSRVTIGIISVTGIILWMRPANGRWRYIVTSTSGYINKMILLPTDNNTTQVCNCKSRDYYEHVLSQWEMKLHCNTISHWLSAYTIWFPQETTYL